MQAPPKTLQQDDDKHSQPCEHCGTQLGDIEWSQTASALVCHGCHERAAKTAKRPGSKLLGERRSSVTASRSPKPSTLNPPPFTLDSLGRQKAEPPEVEWLLDQYAQGRLDPVPVYLPLPDDLPEIARKIADFYALIYGLRLTIPDRRPVPFASRWVGAKVDIPEATVWRARGALVDAGVLEPAEPLPGRGKRPTATYAPGGGAGERLEPGRVVEVRRAAR